MAAPTIRIEALSAEEKRLRDSLVALGDVTHQPEITPKGVTYSTLNDVGERTGWVKLTGLLEALSAKGVLRGEDVEHAIICPSCGSPHVYSRYSCPKCQSTHVLKATLISHPFCGYQGDRESFRRGEEMVCPRCGTSLGTMEGKPKGGGGKDDYRVIGSSFRCEKCDSRFDKPGVVHYCPVCSAVFDYRTAVIRRLYAYRLSPEALTLLQQDPEVEQALGVIQTILREEGYTATRDVPLKGASGSIHRFTLVAEGKGGRFLFDVSPLGNQGDLVALLGKKMDVGGGAAFLVDMRGAEELGSLGKVYGIPVLRAKMGLEDDLRAHLMKPSGERSGRPEQKARG